MGINTQQEKMYLCVGETTENSNEENDQGTNRYENYRYLVVCFDSNGTDDEENVQRIIMKRAILNEIRKKRKFNISNNDKDHSTMWCGNIENNRRKNRD